MKNFSHASPEEFMEDPTKFGAPSFEEFKRNTSKWVGRHDDTMISVEQGPQQVRKQTKKILYEIEGHRCKTLEQVERIAGDYGIPLYALDYTAAIIPQCGGECDILVKFMPKEEIKRRASWS